MDEATFTALVEAALAELVKLTTIEEIEAWLED